MDKLLTKMKYHARLLVQLGFTAATNGNWHGFFTGTIYRGNGKTVCVPGLNCYSCPGALGACPLGSLQSALSAPRLRFPYYIVGLLVVFGALLGRFVCGWLCPFGLVQDLIHRIPIGRKRKKLPGDRWLKYCKYVLLALFVIVLPIAIRGEFGVGMPWFCKFVCPSGTLMAGVPLVLVNPALSGSTGLLFVWKIAILVIILALSVVVWRPFCRYICPLGALYGCLNPVAAARYRVDASRCTACGACQRACKMDLAAYKTPNSPDCVRCGACIKACPHAALSTTLTQRVKPKTEEEAQHDAAD